MGFQPVFLVSDMVLFIIVLAIIVMAIRGSRSPQFRIAWQQVIRQPLGSVSSIILLSFVTVGLLDSLHFRLALPENGHGKTFYSTEVTSVLDSLLAPLAEQQEQTYSAPFALVGYSKESKVDSAGQTQRVYPPLEYAGQHLADPQQRRADIQQRLLLAVLAAVITSLLLAALLCAWVAWRRKITLSRSWRLMMTGRAHYPWRSILLTLVTLLLLCFLGYIFAGKYHMLGTDKVGNDVLYASLKSIRTALLIGSLTTLVICPFALILGTMAGYFGGIIDDTVQYLYTTLSSIPGVLLIAAAILAMQIFIDNHPDNFATVAARADARLMALIVILGITSWTSLCRVLRAETLKLREMDYIQAAKALGTRWHHILSRHVIPNVMHIVLITLVLDFSSLVLAEAVLTYVGVGVDPTTYSWGNMIDGARLELARDPLVWWPLLAAFILMFILVLAANLFADAVRDAFDPKLRFAEPAE